MDAKFSPKVKEVISYSREEALRLNHDFIGIEHILLGLIREGEGLAVRTIKSLNIDPVMLRKTVEESIKDKSAKGSFNPNNLPLTKQAEKVLKITVLEAKVLKSDVIGTEHLILSILKNKDNIVTQIFARFDVDYDVFKRELEEVQKDIKDVRDIKSELPNEPADDEPFEDDKSRGGGFGNPPQGSKKPGCYKIQNPRFG
jgi:ATP-dependent Clp protease ATP-binding subunit ClpC